MHEPWRVAVIGSANYPDANRRIYARLKTLRDDWPKARFHIVTGTTGAVCTAALRAAKKLRMDYSAVSDVGVAGNHERVIAFWDFDSPGTAEVIRRSIDNRVPTEVWDAECEPAGAEAVEALKGS